MLHVVLGEVSVVTVKNSIDLMMQESWMFVFFFYFVNYKTDQIICAKMCGFRAKFCNSAFCDRDLVAYLN